MEPNTPDTSNFLNWVEIKNFKSIKDLRLDCKRVNVFIGKPNVGKSNILEALGLLGADYSVNKFVDFVRYDTTSDLFYDTNIQNDISVNTNRYTAAFTNFNLVKELCRYQFSDHNYNSIIDYVVDQYGIIERSSYSDDILKIILSSVKKYDFNNLLKFKASFGDFLLPPNGQNLTAVINKRDDVFLEMSSLFKEQGLDLIIAERDQTFLLQKKEGSRVKQYPYFSVADTFRRFIFYIVAIESNANSALIFEEPEVHSFPPYTQDLAYRMVYSTDNQFFVSTHSPYLLQTLVENLGDDQLSVFVTYYENYETKAKALTPEELSFVQEYSTDVFFNLDRFIPTPNAASIS